MIVAEGPKRFRARQKLLAPAGAANAIESMARAAGATGEEMESASPPDAVAQEDWMLDCVVDLARGAAGGRAAAGAGTHRDLTSRRIAA